MCMCPYPGQSKWPAAGGSKLAQCERALPAAGEIASDALLTGNDRLKGAPRRGSVIGRGVVICLITGI